MLSSLQTSWGPQGPKHLEARRHGVLRHDQIGQPPGDGKGGEGRRVNQEVRVEALWTLAILCFYQVYLELRILVLEGILEILLFSNLRLNLLTLQQRVT